MLLALRLASQVTCLTLSIYITYIMDLSWI